MQNLSMIYIGIFEILKQLFKIGFWYKITYEFMCSCCEFTKVVFNLKKLVSNVGIESFLYIYSI